MKMNKEQFLKTEFGGELESTITAWDDALSRNREDAAYGKFIGIARERKIPFSYLHGVNMGQIVRQIYDRRQ